MSFVTRPPAPFSSGPMFPLVFLLLLLHLLKPFLLPFISLSGFNSMWILAFLTPSLLTQIVFLSVFLQCVLPVSLYVHFLFVSDLSRDPCLSIQTPDTFSWLPRCVGGPVWNSKEVNPLELDSFLWLHPMEFFKEYSWTRQNLLLWSPGLSSCSLPYSSFSRTWISPSYADSSEASWIPSLSAAAKVLTPFWRCRCADRAGAILLVPEVTSFQPSPLQHSPFPSATNGDSACLSINATWGSGSGTSRVLEKLQLVSCLLSLKLHSLWSPSCNCLSWHHGPPPAFMCYRQGAHLSCAPGEWSLVSPQSLATELHLPVGAHSHLRSLMYQG